MSEVTLTAETGRATGSRPSNRLRAEGRSPASSTATASTPRLGRRRPARAAPRAHRPRPASTPSSTSTVERRRPTSPSSRTSSATRCAATVTHVDFLVVNRDEAITVDVPIVLEGEAKAVVSEGGLVEQTLMHPHRLARRPRNIPNEITVDVSDLDDRRRRPGRRPGAARAASPPTVDPDDAVVVTAQVTRRRRGRGGRGRGAEARRRRRGRGRRRRRRGRRQLRVAPPMALFGRAVAGRERRGTPADLLVRRPRQPRRGVRRHAATTSAPRSLGVLARRHGGTLKRSKERALTGEVTHRRPAGRAGLPADLHERVGRVGLAARAPLRHRATRAARRRARRARPAARAAEGQGGRRAGRPQRAAVDQAAPAQPTTSSGSASASASRRAARSRAPTTC